MKVLSFLKGYKKEVILAPAFKMLEALFELFIPLVVASIIDEGIANGNTPYIWKMGMIMIGLGIVGLVSSVTAQFFAAKAAVGFSKELRSVLFAKIQSLSFSEIDNLGTSKLITRMTSDVNQAQTGVNLVLRLFLRSPFIVFGAMIMAFTQDTEAAMIFVVTIPVLAIIVYGIMLITMPMYKKVQKYLENLTKITRNNLAGMRVIRAFCKEEEEIEEFDRENKRLNRMQKIVGRISGLLNPLTFIVINVAIIILIHTGAVRVEMGILSQGTVIALYNYMSQILVELIKLANLIVTTTKAVASGKRIEEILNMESSLKLVESDKMEDEKLPKVSFEHVSLTYGGSAEETLSDIHFDVMPGETVGIIGGTGSGKSSLVHLIPHFYDTTNGNVLVSGKNVNEYDCEELRNKIGIVMQKAVLFKGTIRENLMWGKKDATEEEILDAVKLACAMDVVNSKEKGIDSEVLQAGKNFSGGQRQRLSIARAFVRRPEILIFDDSASALDFLTDKNLRENIKNMNYNPTVFIVSQRTSSIKHADKIVVLEDGKVCGIGSHSELVKNCQVYREIHESQFKEALKDE